MSLCVFGSVLPRVYHQHLPTSTNVYQQKPMNSRRFLLKASGPKRIRVENTDHTPQFLPEGAATSLGRVLGQGSCLRRCNQNHNKKRPDRVREKAHETSLPVGAPWGPRPLGSPLAQTLLSESPKELNQIASPTNPQRPQSWAPLKAGRPTLPFPSNMAEAARLARRRRAAASRSGVAQKCLRGRGRVCKIGESSACHTKA